MWGEASEWLLMRVTVLITSSVMLSHPLSLQNKDNAKLQTKQSNNNVSLLPSELVYSKDNLPQCLCFIQCRSARETKTNQIPTHTE